MKLVKQHAQELLHGSWLPYFCWNNKIDNSEEILVDSLPHDNKVKTNNSTNTNTQTANPPTSMVVKATNQTIDELDEDYS